MGVKRATYRVGQQPIGKNARAPGERPAEAKGLRHCSVSIKHIYCSSSISQRNPFPREAVPGIAAPNVEGSLLEQSASPWRDPHVTGGLPLPDKAAREKGG